MIKGSNNENVIKNSNPYNKENLKDFYIISENAGNKLSKQYNLDEHQLKKGEGVLYIYDIGDSSFMGAKKMDSFKNMNYLNLNVNGNLFKTSIKEKIKGGIINAGADYMNVLVINNEDFKTLLKKVPDNMRYIYYGYNIKNSYKASSAVTEIKNKVNKGEDNNFNERVISSAAMNELMSLFLFIGTFIAIIFFIAMGSILYFKMFNEIQKDRFEFIALKKLGLSESEIRKIVSEESFIIFFLPFIIAICHAAFAVKSVGLLNMRYFLVITVIYLFLQITFYLFAKWMYMKQINNLC